MQALQVKIAVKYSRVSTNKQDLRGSKDGQEAEIDKFASTNGFTIIDSFTDTDHGDIAKRKGLTSMKEYLRLNQAVKYVLVYHSDRFTRNFQDGMRDLFFLEDLGIKLISVLEGEILADGTFNSLPSLVRLIGAQEDKAKIIKKTTDASYKYAKTNRYLGGNILPWFKLESGYVYGKKCKVIVKNETTWEYYRGFFLTIIKYKNILRAAKEYNLNRFTAAEWLAKQELIGYRTYGKKGKIDQYHNKGRRKNYQTTEEKVFPAILTEDEFLILNEMRKHNRVKYNKDIYTYLYSIISYHSCGGKLEGERIKKKDSFIYYYKCNCCKKRFNQKKLELAIAENILSNPGLQIINDINFRLADIYDEIKNINNMIEEENSSEKRILSLVSKNIVGIEAAEEELLKIKKQKNFLKKLLEEKMKLIAEENKKEITEDHISLLKNLLEYSQEEDDDFREKLKEIINLIIKKIEVSSLDKINVIF